MNQEDTTTHRLSALGASKVVAFVGTTNAEHAKHFYADTLGLAFKVDDGFALIFDANGTTLRVSRVQTVADAKYTVLGWEVKEISSIVQSLREKGVKFQHFENFGQDQLGIWTAPDGTKVAWFKDPDGNILSLTDFPQSDV